MPSPDGCDPRQCLLYTRIGEAIYALDSLYNDPQIHERDTHTLFTIERQLAALMGAVMQEESHTLFLVCRSW